ncbi:MAG: hypothetical protein ABI686_13975 [Acidobacteriota bacterium]
MNKHIVGFILFNLIVGTSIITAAFFYQMPKYESVVVTPVTSETYTRSCWRSNKGYANKISAPKVTQAIFDRKTGEIKTELFIQSKNESTEDFIVGLHFFVKDGNSTRYLSTQEISESVSNDAKDSSFVTYSYDVIDVIDDLKQSENLYVIPEIISNANNYSDYTPVFDEANATPVTLAR